MEFDCNNVDENEKYAFLLGSAIKNEDSDQFFSIYDSIIPKDLPDTQVKNIKKRVREILDLPEEEFNDLVSKARYFSLASAGTSTMSCRELSDHNKLSQHLFEESEDEGLGSATQSQIRSVKSETSSLYSVTKCSTVSSESETQKYEEDLNLCNSSKTTNSLHSLSDQDGSDNDGKGCYFDYYPSTKIRYPPQVKIRNGLGINLDYDEAFEVKSDHSSHDDVNSPRSDISDGVEMVTMGPGSRHFSVEVDDDLSCNRRGTSIDQDDFNTSGESDNENQRNRDFYKQGYRPLIRETKALTATKYYNASSSLQYPEVDHPISFSSLKDGTPRYSRHSPHEHHGTASGLTAGTKDVKFEKNSYKKDRPPFGGKEQFNKVANSIDSLITSVPDHEVKNMPEGRKLEMLTPEESKKKKKKKKKDDVGTDQNGNPLVSQKDIKAYRQMRESPSNSEGTAGNCQNITNYGAYPYSAPSNEHYKDDDASTRLHDRHRKSRRNKTKEIEKKSEDVQNYVGDKLEIEDLVHFIDGQNVSLKKSKKQSPSITEDIPNKTQKQNKKSKDKKQKSPTPSIEEVETKGDNTAQSAILNQQVGLNNMGNLSGKTEVHTSIENDDTIGSIAKKEKLPKSLLKDDRKLVVSDSIIANNHIPHASNKAVHCKESVKDKEVPKTNNRRVAASETNAGEIKQKKGGDKLKASKNERIDMSVFKSENTMKIDTSLEIINSINVKQKNSKNKRSKPTSPSAKAENDVQAPDVLNNESLFSSMLDANLIDNSDFIFTDLDVPQVPKEDEFQVVGKKKKKPAKEVAQPYQQNNYNYVNNGNKYGKRYDEKSRSNSYVNNKFPPPVTNSYSLQADTDIRDRDLSPSAFPALCSGKGRQSVNDGRRNSTGDVQIPSDLKLQDDCDRESVKSLPATKASNTLETATSPRINMSYAKMAAGVAIPVVQPISSLGVENDSSDPKITVWKGNARERRHSIGSSPDGVGVVATHTQSSSTVVALKAGSQENLKDILLDDIISGNIKTEDSYTDNPIIVTNPQRNVAPECNTDRSLKEKDTRTTVKEAKENALSNSVHSQPHALSKSDSSGNSTVAPTDISDQFKEIACSGKSSNIKGVKVKGIESEGRVSSVIQPTDKLSVFPKNENSQKSKNNSTNNRKQKSVIFYDKRLEETSTSLDISFGFELNSVEETLNSIDRNFQEMSTIVNPSDNLDAGKTEIKFESLDLPACDLVQTINCASITFDSNSTLDQSSNINVIETSSDSYINKSSGIDNIDKELNADIIEQVEKVSSKLVHLNGVVSQSQGKNSKQVCAVLEEDKTLILNETGSQPVQITNKVETVKVQDAHIEGIYYGENVATLKKDVVGPSSTNGPTSYCGVIHFLLEMEAKNNFNLSEAATYLTKESERTLNLQVKDPDCIKVHHE